jgi:lipoprotein-anchoring transpeptidase ErfK/SrfK
VACLSATPAAAREVVAFRDNNVSAGTVVVRTHERRLYYVLGDGKAIRYPVGVGMSSKQWAGTTRIDGKYIKPAWSPPKDVKRDKPSGGEYAIHGTNMPGSVGGFVSYGCIRMFNQDVVDLYSRVSVGTTVMVVR